MINLLEIWVTFQGIEEHLGKSDFGMGTCETAVNCISGITVTSDK